MIRQPKAAGTFYPAEETQLRKQLRELIKESPKKESAVGIVSPHAGYVFSGRIAGRCFAQVNLTKTVIVLGPNHTGLGAPFSIMAEDAQWQMPLGIVPVDCHLVQQILAGSKHLKNDSQAHLYEHSIEVQLPFLQYILPRVQIVPIILAHADFDTYDEIGESIAEAVEKNGRKCLIIASSDMSHYEPEEQARAKDKTAIEAILNLDARELLQRIDKSHISMCGYGAVAVMLSAAKRLKACRARLLQYQTSGDVTGDYSSVVGYAGILVQ
ncbi:MAG: AmmeMemoRadiSam system protein B [Candidatus Omnitrophota bacterium]